MEDIIHPTTDFNKLLTSQYFIKNEIFLSNPLQDGTTIIDNEKLAQFLEMLQKQLFEINAQVTTCVSEDLYRQEIQERFELTRKMDSTLLDINFLREYIYFGDPLNKPGDGSKGGGAGKDKTQFIVGEMENLKMMMKRIEKQQYEGLDLFRRVKKSETHIVTLAKLLNERMEKEKFMALQIEELQNQMNEMRNQIDSNQQGAEKRFTEHNDRLTEIESTLEEEIMEQEASVSETRSLMRSMSFSIGDIEEDLRRRLRPLNSVDEDEIEEPEVKDRSEQEMPMQLQSFDYQDQATTSKTVESTNLVAANATKTETSTSSTVEVKTEEVKSEKQSTSGKRKSVSFVEQKPFEESESFQPRAEPIQEYDDQPEHTSSNIESTPSEDSTQRRQQVILQAGRVLDPSEYESEGMLRRLSRGNSMKTTYPSYPSSTRSTMYEPGQQSSLVQKYFQKNKDKYKNDSRRSSRLDARHKSAGASLELLDFLKTQYFEKLQNVEYQAHALHDQVRHVNQRFHQFNLSYLKKILMIFSNSYSKQMKKQAFQKLLNNKLSYDRRIREGVLRNCTIFFNRLLKSTIKYNFKKWRRNCDRLKRGEKMKLWLTARLEKWYEHVKPNLKDYINRWKIFTIASYRASIFEGGDDDDVDALRNANNQYFLSLRQTLLNKGELNMEELKHNALQDLKTRWSSADRKAREEARYLKFEERMIVRVNEHFYESFAEEKAKYELLNSNVESLLRDMLFVKKDLGRATVQLGEMDTILAEHCETTINKVMTHLNQYKSQYTIQMSYMKEAIDETINQLNEQLKALAGQVALLESMKQSYEQETVPTIEHHKSEIGNIHQQLDQDQQLFQALKEENELKDKTIVSIQETINNNQKQQEKSLKALEAHVDASNEFYSEEMLWMKNLTKSIHQSVQDFKGTYDTFVNKTTKTIDVILSGESSHEQYQLLLKTVCHYYRQYEFFQLIQVQQVILSKEIQQEQQKLQDEGLLVEPNSTGSTNALQKKLKALNEIKEKYSQQFIHEQRKKISDELGEAVRRIAFYVVVKSDNYVTSYYIQHQVLKVNNTFKLDQEYNQPPPLHSNNNNNDKSANTSNRPHSANATSSKLKASKLPPKSPDRQRSNSPGRPKTSTKTYAFDDNEATNAKMNKVTTHLYDFNNDNLSVDSIRKQYLGKIREEIENKLSAKDEKQLYKSASFSSFSSQTTGATMSAADLLLLTTSNISMIKDIREKFIIQFMKMLEIALVSFPKIPFFHGVNSLLRTNSIFPATSHTPLLASGVHAPLEQCLACDRPLIDDWKAYDGGGNGRGLTRRPRSASHITSTYHHNPFQGFLQQTLTQGLQPMTVYNQQGFVPIALAPSQASGGPIHTRSVDFLPPIQQVLNSSIESQTSFISTTGGEAEFIENKASVASYKSNTNQSQKSSKSNNNNNNQNNNFNASTSMSLSKSASNDNRSVTHEVVVDDTPSASAKLTITLKSRKETRSPSPSPATSPISKLGSPKQLPYDRVQNEFTIRTTLSPTNRNRSNTSGAPSPSIIETYSQVQANATLPGNLLENTATSFVAEATIPAVNSEILVDTLAHQFPKDVSIRPKYMESSIAESNTPEISLQSRKLFGKEETNEER